MSQKNKQFELWSQKQIQLKSPQSSQVLSESLLDAGFMIQEEAAIVAKQTIHWRMEFAGE